LGRDFQITETATSKTGKHGHAKVTFAGVDIFTGKKYSDVVPGHAVFLSPPVTRMEYTLMDIDTKNNTLTCLKQDGSEHVLEFQCNAEEKSDMHEAAADLITAFAGGNGPEIQITTIVSCEEPQKEVFVQREAFLSFKAAAGQE